MQQTLAELRDLDPTRRQTKLCNEWDDMKQQVVIFKEGDIKPLVYNSKLGWSITTSLDNTVTPHGYGSQVTAILFNDLQNPQFRLDGEIVDSFPIYRIQIETRHATWNNTKNSLYPLPSINDMAMFDRVGSLTNFFCVHCHYDKNQTYRVISQRYCGGYRLRTYNTPYYIFYRQEVVPPPWQWMLRKGTFLNDNLPEEEEAELCQRWGIQRVQSNLFLLQVKWWHPFSLIKEVARLALGGGTDLYIPIAHFLCALQTQEVSYHHSLERKKYESQWTKEDHERNERLRGELFAMVDGLTVFNEEEPPKKKRRLQ